MAKLHEEPPTLGFSTDLLSEANGSQSVLPIGEAGCGGAEDCEFVKCIRRLESIMLTIFQGKETGNKGDRIRDRDQG